MKRKNINISILLIEIDKKNLATNNMAIMVNVDIKTSTKNTDINNVLSIFFFSNQYQLFVIWYGYNDDNDKLDFFQEKKHANINQKKKIITKKFKIIIKMIIYRQQ